MTVSARRNPAPPGPVSPTRGWLARHGLTVAACAASLALVAAAVAAVGPARADHAEYTWPPAILSTSEPDQGWYAPLPLLNRVPSSLVVQLPCGLAPPLRGKPSATVLATARFPGHHGGLRISPGGGAMHFGVGESAVASVPWPASCPLRVEVADGELRLPDRTVRLETDTLGDMPVVTGLFSSLDLRLGEAPEVVVRPRPSRTTQTLRQRIAAALAAVLAGIALVLLTRPDATPRRRSLRHALGTAWGARDPTDAVVVGALLVWWIVAPVHFDDGWLWVQNRAFDDVGGVGSYYLNWGVNSALGYWLEWLRHWLLGSTSHVVVARLPSLVALVAAWVLCRWCLPRVVGARPRAVVRWTLAGAFLVGATSWGMTLRPEPFVVLLAAVSLAAMVAFVRSPSLAPIAVAALATILAATTHPVGIVAAAPFLAATPDVVRWLRAGGLRLLLALGCLAVATLALALVFFTLGADLQTRVDDARVLSGGEYHGEPWWREYRRYTGFDGAGGATAIRRLGLALLLLSVLAALTRRRGVGRGILLMPARNVAVGLALLALVPSKWAAHFGVLAAVGAVAVAAETARLIQTSDLPGRLPIRHVLAPLVVAGVSLWAWRAPGSWSLLDLQELSWNDGFGVKSYGWIGVAAVVAGLVVGVRRRQGSIERPALVGWAVTVVSLAVVAVTIAVLVVDSAISPWSPARQNLEALAGGGSCGLAHHLTGREGLVARIGDPESRTLLEPPVALYFPCATIPAIGDGLVELPGLVVYQSGLWPIQDPTAPFAAVSDLYGFEPIAQGPRGVEVLAVPERIPGHVRADAMPRQ